MGRRVNGNFRSLLKRLPDSVSEELRTLQNETGKMLLARAYARVPSRTGALRAGLSYSVTPKTLRLRFGILGKAKNRRLFYGRILEFGRKAQIKWVVRGAARQAVVSSPSGKSSRYRAALRASGVGYRMRVRAKPGRFFIYNTPREQIYRPYQKLWGKALHRAAAGSGGD